MDLEFPDCSRCGASNWDVDMIQNKGVWFCEDCATQSESNIPNQIAGALCNPTEDK